MARSFADLLEEIEIKKDRCQKALQDPQVSDSAKQRVLLSEFQTYVLALEGAKVFQKERERLGLSDTDPVTTVARQTL